MKSLTVKYGSYFLSVGLFLGGFLSPIASAKEVNVTFHNRLVDNKKTWVPEPENVEIKKGSIVKVQVINHLEEPHGFFLPGFTDPLVVPGKLKEEEAPKLSFSFVADKDPGSYDYKCHMHPAHVGGSYKIVP